jgi:hypothetical protein
VGRTAPSHHVAMPNPIAFAVSIPFTLVGVILDVTFPRPQARLG